MSIECLKYVSHPEGNLQGFADLRIHKMGIDIFGFKVFKTEHGARWLGFPGVKYYDASKQILFNPFQSFFCFY